MAHPSPQSHSEPATDLALVAIVLLMLTVGALWLAGTASAVVSGHRAPHGHPLGELAAFAHVGDPSLGWHAPVGPAVLYWAVTALTLALLGFVLWGAWRIFRPARPGGRTGDDPTKLDGLANRAQVLAAAGPKALVAQAKVLRPSLEKPKPRDVGWYLGHSRGVGCWMGVRDSLVLVGPPGAGIRLQLRDPVDPRRSGCGHHDLDAAGQLDRHHGRPIGRRSPGRRVRPAGLGGWRAVSPPVVAHPGLRTATDRHDPSRRPHRRRGQGCGRRQLLGAADTDSGAVPAPRCCDLRAIPRNPLRVVPACGRGA